MSCLCHTCKTYKDRLHSCLHCIFFGCYVKGHIQEHAKTKKHFLGKKKKKYSKLVRWDSSKNFMHRLNYFCYFSRWFMLWKYLVLPMWRLRIRQGIASSGKGTMQRVSKIPEFRRVLSSMGTHASRGRATEEASTPKTRRRKFHYR